MEKEFENKEIILPSNGNISQYCLLDMSDSTDCSNDEGN